MHTKPMKIILELRNGPKYVSVIAKKIDCTYSHTVKLLNLFNNAGLVEFEKKGRIKMVKLTSFGEEVGKAVENLIVKITEGRKAT